MLPRRTRCNCTVTDDTHCPVWHKLAICRKETGSDHCSSQDCRTGTGFKQHNTGSSCIATFCVLAPSYPAGLFFIVSEELGARLFKIGWKLRPENGDSICLRNVRNNTQINMLLTERTIIYIFFFRIQNHCGV